MSFAYAYQYGPDDISSRFGAPLPNQLVSIYITGTKTLATLYTNAAKAANGANPLTTDSLGNLTFFADPGSYDISVDSSTFTVMLPLNPSEVAAGSAGGDLRGSYPNPLLASTANVESVISSNSTVASALQSLTAADSTVTVGGTATAPTVKVTSGTYVQPAGQNGSQVTPSLLPFFNVKDYGAKGDGSTDDTTAIAAAITAATTNGGTVWLPPGTFIVNTPLNMPNGVTFRGAGINATTLKAGTTMAASGTPIAVFKRVSANAGDSIIGVSVYDMTINAVAGPTGQVDGIWIDSSVSTSVVYQAVVTANLWIENALIGVRSDASNANGGAMNNDRLVDKCTFTNCGVGVLSTGTYGQRVTNSEFFGCTIAAIGTGGVTPGITAYTGTGPTAMFIIDSCHIEGLGNLTGGGSGTESGIYVSMSIGSVTNCLLDNVSRWGIAVSANEACAAVIQGCSVYGNGWSALYLTGGSSSQHGICSDCSVTDVAQATSGGNSEATQSAVCHGSGNWDIHDIRISTAYLSNPKHAIAIGADTTNAYNRVNVSLVNCPATAGSWLSPPAFAQNGVLKFKDCYGYNPPGTLGLNLLSAADSSFETGVGTFTAGANCTVAQSVAQALFGTHSLSLTSAASGLMYAQTANNSYAASPNVLYTASAYFRTAVSGRSCTVQIAFYTSGGTLLNYQQGPAVVDTTSGWVRATCTLAGVATAAFAQVTVLVSGTGGASEVHYVDGIQLEQSPMVGAWGLGGTVGIPTTATAGPASYFDEIHYITASTSTVAYAITNAAGTSQTVTTIPSSGYGNVFVPAGFVVTPTYTVLPTISRYAQ